MENGVECKKSLKDFAFIGIKNDNAKLLFNTIRSLQPKVILELGCCLGFSSILFKVASPNSKIYTLEGDENLAQFAHQNFTHFGFSDIHIVQGKFSQTLSNLLNQIQQIDFAFIDGHHDKDATISYFKQILPFISKNSIMAFDDINYNEKMQEAWQEISQNVRSFDDGKIGIIKIK